MFAILPYDMLLYIVSFLYNINDYTQVMLLNKNIYNYLNDYNYKRRILNNKLLYLQFKYNAIEEKNYDDLYYPSSFINQWNIYNCVSSKCIHKNDNETNAIGVAYTYTITYNEWLNSRDTWDFSNIKLKKHTRRFIPYCINCMIKYINGGYEKYPENKIILALSDTIP